MKDSIKEPCFGVISLHKTFGGGKHNRLFMSAIDNPTSVRIEISHAEMLINEFGEERVYHDGLPIICIEMSPTQFSDLLLNGNVDCGIPCTIKKLNGKAVPGLQEEVKNKRERVQDFYKAKMKEAIGSLLSSKGRVEELMKKQSLSKADKAEIINMFDAINTKIALDFPFWAEMFNETMDKITSECKSEIDAIFQSLINKVGLESLQRMGINTPKNPLVIEAKID